MKQVKLEAESLNGIMTVTSDFINTKLLPKYNEISIKTYKLNNEWISQIKYK